KSGKTPVLVASDIAARGLDVDDISHVVNYDLSNEPETYVHRIGRTARAGASGSAVSFCDPEERGYLRAIERLIRKSIAVKSDHPQYVESQSRAPHATHVAPTARPVHRVDPKKHAQAPAPTRKPARHPHPLWSYGTGSR